MGNSKAFGFVFVAMFIAVIASSGLNQTQVTTTEVNHPIHDLRAEGAAETLYPFGP